MDALTAFFISALMIMLNGAVLGLMLRDLPESLRPSAMSWRLGTLLQAAGCVVLAVQRSLPREIALPLAHTMLMLGITFYWQALRQFSGLPRSPWLLLPAALGAVGMVWFSAIGPSQAGRILLAAAVWATIIVGCIATLRTQGGRDSAHSRRVLTGVFIGVAVAIAIAGLVFGLPGTLRDALRGAGWVQLIAPLIAAVLPVVGTTAFLQLCSDRIRRQWEHAASTDLLTGLPNRRTLASAGARLFDSARAAGRSFSVAVIDIDHFKPINDRFGHETGDEALRHVAGLIESACELNQLPGRQGGEEFVVIFAGIGIEAAAASAERIRGVVEARPFAIGDESLPITLSIGLTAAGAADRCLDDLLRRADRALYAAKAAGRNRVVVAGAQIDPLPTALRSAA